jgi:hypothetical protein
MIYECFWIDFSPQGRYVLLPIVTLTAVAWVGPLAGGTPRARLWTGLAIGYLRLAAGWSLWLLVRWPCGPDVALPGS